MDRFYVVVERERKKKKTVCEWLLNCCICLFFWLQTREAYLHMKKGLNLKEKESLIFFLDTPFTPGIKKRSLSGYAVRITNDLIRVCLMCSCYPRWAWISVVRGKTSPRVIWGGSKSATDWIAWVGGSGESLETLWNAVDNKFLIVPSSANMLHKVLSLLE